jgi:hypothetical protein
MKILGAYLMLQIGRLKKCLKVLRVWAFIRIITHFFLLHLSIPNGPVALICIWSYFKSE